MRKNNIKSEIRKKAPNLSSQIINRIDWQNVEKSNHKKVNFVTKFVFSGACLLVLLLSVVLPIALKHNSPTEYAVTLEVNPCIKLVADKNDIVTKQIGLNEDGSIFLYKENLIGLNIDQASRIVIEKLNKFGFLTETMSIKVTYLDGKEYKSKQDLICKDLNNYLTEFGNFQLNMMDDDAFDEIENYYRDNNISEYEKNLFENFRNKLFDICQIKIEDMESLLQNLNNANYVVDKDDQIENFTLVNEMNAFGKKYNYKFDFNLECVTYHDIYGFAEELEDDIEDIQEALGDMLDGADEDDFADALDDLFDLVEEILYQED